MKRILFYLTMCLGGAFAVLPMTSCEKPAEKIGVTNVSLSAETLTIYLADNPTATLVATVTPKTASNKKLKWESDDPDVVEVDDKGNLEALKVGETIITVTTDDGGFEDKCTVTVKEKKIVGVPVGSIVFKWERATVEIEGDPYTMSVEVLPAEAGDKRLTWMSDNIGVATVDTNGAVTGLTAGTTTITATAADGSRTTANWKVTVLAAPDMTGCAEGTPRFGTTLGEITFKTDETWEIGGQLWSDVVMSSVASARTDFMGSDQNSTIFYCDCRKGNEGYGDFFSWCAANRFRAQLCPDGWRIPTTDDFVALDLAIGGTGLNRYDYNFVSTYLTEWGGEYGGNVTTSNTVQAAGVVAYYLAQSVETLTPINGKYLGLQKGGNIYVNQSTPKNQGMTLRCVR